MAKQHLLIVDSDPKSLRVLEVSLKKAGFSITRASNGLDAIEKIQISVPDMIITETNMPEMGGFELIDRLRENADWQDIPVMFLTAQKSIEDKIRGLEQGVEDYLTKPIFIREILARVSLVMQRRQRERLETRGSKTEFAGSLSDMGIIDLIQTIDISQKSGVIHVERDEDSGEIYFRNGKVVDAVTSSRKGEEAVYRMLVWSHGHFRIEFNNLERPDKITLSTQGLLMEGMRRLDEWGRLQEQLPSLNSVFDIDDELLAERLGEIPDEINSLLKHFDGRRSLMEVVNLCPLGDLEALTIITKLYFEGLICDLGMAPESPTDALESPISDVDNVELLHEVTSPPAEPPREVSPNISSHETPREETMRVSTADSDQEGSSDVRQSLQGNFVHVLTRSSVPAAPHTNDEPAPQGPEKRPNTGEYRLSRHPMPSGEASETGESAAAGAPSAGLSSGMSEQQTMMMHVSRTPTNPPPAVNRLSSDVPNPVPVEEEVAKDKAMTSSVEGRETPTTATVESTKKTMVSVAGVAELEQMSAAAAASSDAATNRPVHKPLGEMDEDIQPGMSVDTVKEKPVEAAVETVNVAAEGSAAIQRTQVDTTVPAKIISDKETGGAKHAFTESAEDVAEDTTDTDALAAAEKALQLMGEMAAVEKHTDGNDAATEFEEEAEEADDDEVYEDDDAFEDEEEDDEWAMVDGGSVKRMRIVIVALAAVLLLGGGAALYFGTDIFKKSETSTSTASDGSASDGADKTSKEGEPKKGDSQAKDKGAATKKSAAADKLADGASGSEVLKAEKDGEDTRATTTADALETPVGSAEDASVADESGGGGDDTLSATPTESAAPAPADAATLTKYNELVARAAKLPRKKKIEVLEEAIALNPNGVEALAEFAVTTMEMKKYHQQALEYGERATVSDPKNAKAWLAIGYIYQLKNESEKSTAAYEKCAACDGPKEFVRNCKLLSR